MLEVVVIGGVAMDLVALVEKLPTKDQIVKAHSFIPYPGGSSANVAVALARLGHKVGFIGKVGDDNNGTQLIEAFKEDGVNIKGLKIDKNRLTGSCFITVDAEGNRTIIAIDGATIIEGVEEITPHIISGVKAIYIGASYLEVAIKAAQMAKREQGIVFYAPGGVVASNGLNYIKPVLELTDVLILNRAEIEMLTPGVNPKKASKHLLRQGPRRIIVSLGNNGVLLAETENIVIIPAIEVSNVKDTTGAGDALAAGIISGFLNGLSWQEAARKGCAVAAIKIQHLGARSGLPSTPEVQKLLKSLEGG